VSLPERLASLITDYSRVAIAAMLVLTLLLGSGAGMVEQSSSLSQFEGDSEEVKAQAYIEENFVPPEEQNVTTVQVIVRGDDVLTRESLLSSLRYQQTLREDEMVNDTLDQEQPALGVSNLVASTVINRERAAELEARTAPLSDALNRTAGLQQEYDQLNASYERGEVDDQTYEERSTEIERSLVATRTNATADLTGQQAVRFNQSATQVRNVTHQTFVLEGEYERGEIDQSTYEERSADLAEQRRTAFQQGTRDVFAEEFNALREQPPLDEQIQKLEEMDDDEVEAIVAELLDPESGQSRAYQLMSTSYEAGETSANARMMFVRQEVADAGSVEQGDVSDRLVDSQLRMQKLADDSQTENEYVVFGFGLISDEIDRSMGDSIAIVGPLALLFVVLTLIVAYRDLLDIVLGVVGIVAVLVWTFGFMGWVGITFNQIFIAVPVLLIGLSIDYAIHVFMRHREQRQERSAAAGDGPRGSMSVALTGVGVALVWVTATTVIGFLSNLVSPLGPIREFGIVSSFGIVAALLIFGVLVPALKVELDEFLEGRGIDRKKRAFGTGGGRLGQALGTGAVLARKAPVAVLAVALVLSVAGGAAATQVDTSFDQQDFIADDPPAWMDNLPSSIQPGEYNAKDHLNYVNDNFIRQDSQGEILVNGSATDPETLQRIDEAEAAAAEKETVIELSNGQADVRSPLQAMQNARNNETFNATFNAADTDGDGVPDRNVEEVYDALYETAPAEAAQVVHRTDDGEYDAVRMSISVKGGAGTAEVTEDMRSIVDGIDEDGTSDSREAVATGSPIVNEIVQGQLFDTVIQSLLVTLVTVFLFLAVVYRFQHGSATLGIVTMLPVALAVSWILGTMYLLGMPFNVLTGMITSLTIGLGVAYSIHVSERYTLELDRQPDAWEAMRVSVTGTGGALLGSAATTVGGFGVLVFAILPVLEQFGLITGMTIIYAFLGSVVVLPSLLVLWTRYLGPAESLTPADAGPAPDPAADGSGVHENE
jgi:hydrophobe/amphiphile efflux-3 (HAE3) family protein